MSLIVGTDGQPLASASAYRGASLTDREIANWLPPLSSADAELNHERSTLVSRSRDLVRNHGIASGAIQTLVDNVVGSGLRLSATPDYKSLGLSKEWADEWSRKVESLWRSWAETTRCDVTGCLTFSGLTQQVFRSTLLNGEALALPLWLPKRLTHLHFATTLQLIETDRLSNPQGRLDSDRLRSGIELDQYGAPLAYWLTKHHPGDSFLNGHLTRVHQRIPAFTAFGRQRVIHVFEQERTGQRRGKPALTSVMPLFKMLDHYERSEMQAAVVNAMIAAFIETPLDSESISELFGGSSDSYLNAKKQWQVKLQGGAVIPMFPGDKVAPFTPGRPNAAYAQFVENVQRHIGNGLNLPFELVMKDFSKTNYASVRASLMEAWRFFTSKRQWLSTYWAKPVYELWLEEAIHQGRIEAPHFYQNKPFWTRCKWIGPGRGWIDPVKEAKASQMRLQVGLSTLEDECAMQGLDWEEVMEQQAREQAKQSELSITTKE